MIEPTRISFAGLTASPSNLILPFEMFSVASERVFVRRTDQQYLSNRQGILNIFWERFNYHVV